MRPVGLIGFNHPISTQTRLNKLFPGPFPSISATSTMLSSRVGDKRRNFVEQNSDDLGQLVASGQVGNDETVSDILGWESKAEALDQQLPLMSRSSTSTWTDATSPCYWP
jgi:hypothetical protein